MDVSVILRSKDEADRLRLTLASLARQSLAAEIVIVDDGSRDHTPCVIAAAARTLPVVALRHESPQGRSAAANAGAAAAQGEILIFLDGDTLAGPDFVAAHAQAHAAHPALCGRGETWHLRQTRSVLDPETASPQPGREAALARLPSAERDALKVTRRQIAEDFASIERRASPGIYPGAGPRALYDVEISALREHPDCRVLWAAASGANLSVRRARFLAVGGFDAALDLNAHREFALRLCQAGTRMGFVAGARSYHLTHRTGWRDPLQMPGWEETFYRRHPIQAVKLLAVLWASLSDPCPIPPAARLHSLPALEQAAQGGGGVDYDAVRRAIPSLAVL